MKLLASLAAMPLLLLAPIGADAAAPKEGRFPPLGDCRDDRGVDRCDPAQHRRVLALYGVQPIEAHLAAGDIVRRAFFVDGYGSDRVAISFVRAKGRDPALWVHVPSGKEQGRAPMQAPVPGPVWDDLIRRSAHFDRTLAPPKPGPDGEEEVLCIHSWVYTLEATELPDELAGQPGRVRRKTEDACDDGLAEAYALELARAAVPLLPACALIDPRQQRGLPGVLSACFLLTGDRLAAAEVLNRLNLIQAAENESDAARAEQVFGPEAQLDWQGSRSADRAQAAKLWLAKLAEGGGAQLFYDKVEGLSPDRVRFVGFLSRYAGEANGESVNQFASVEQIWTREGGDFFIERAIVGPWERER
ncbi:MAG TPA: hypothetical protein VF589_01115 [Allosphingosinicella sp.]|jgi:hypothetical protein